MSAAIQRLKQAIAEKEKIVVYGDYDVDGLTATAFLLRVLREYTPNVVPFLPNRMDEGYGLSMEGLHRCLTTHSPTLLIAIDCGTGSISEIAEARARGVDVIVLDHHQPSSHLPDCVAVVNPKHLAESPPWRDLCSAGLAFKFGHALLKSQNSEPKAQSSLLKTHLDLAALGTIADIVPLTGENRILTKAGLIQLGQTNKVGLQELMRKAQMADGARIEPSHVGFRLGPRLNAAGRLGDAQASLELLLTDDGLRAKELAKLLDENNRQRQQIEKRALEEALVLLQDFDVSQRVIVLAKEGWHIGVVGIVAARIVREFYRPTVVIGIDEEGMGRGSCRSIEGFDIVEGLASCSDLLERFGGHQMAAGVSIHAKRVAEFRARLNATAEDQLSADDLLPQLKVDAELSLLDTDEKLLNEIEQLEPFGQENPPPLFLARGVTIKSAATVGEEGRHLKLWLTDGKVTRQAIGFGLATRCEWLGPFQSQSSKTESRSLVDIVFTPEINEFRDQRAIQLNLKDIRPS